MKIEVEFDERDIEPIIKKAIADHIHRIVNSVTEKVVREKFTSPITEAVELHLAKRLTNQDIQSQIDKAIVDRLRESVDY